MQRKTRAVTAATVAAIVAAAVVAKRRAEHGDGHRPVISHASTTSRNAKLATVGARAGGTYAVHRARRAFASAERKEELDRAFELQTAEQVAEALGHMKGAMMKLGQMASYLDEGLPEPLRMALAQLRSGAPPMSAELAAGVVEAELGMPPADLFVEWDPQPIAAASIGQVHRAIYADPDTGEQRAVAVKVQYPGVDEAIAADLRNADILGTILKQGFGGLEPDEMVAEIKERLTEELDYELEARNQQVFVDFYRDHPYIHVPEVVPELSTGRVLTTELVNGHSWDELLTWDQRERDLAGETIFRFVFRSLYRMRAFNGDPHPGNYLFHGHGKVTFLDFGLVKHFTEP
ncbi:MAG: AarF/ABC1/UbiB kinase family protein, partial [Acidimicrobiales bacterium]